MTEEQILQEAIVRLRKALELERARVKELETQNAALKKLVAERSDFLIARLRENIFTAAIYLN